ncbi:MAG: hypothetical protein QOK08_2287 [Actinomycetota bacterium]|jgi:hypothetical protein|nr:hypothetical protein [Glaciihabitans sp.]MDQ1544649.1 hypothetical protein [Actinomycetota bacterium]
MLARSGSTRWEATKTRVPIEDPMPVFLASGYHLPAKVPRVGFSTELLRTVLRPHEIAIVAG